MNKQDFKMDVPVKAIESDLIVIPDALQVKVYGNITCVRTFEDDIWFCFAYIQKGRYISTLIGDDVLYEALNDFFMESLQPQPVFEDAEAIQIKLNNG